MDHKVSKDMISSGMIPSGEKTQADLGRTQYGSAPSPSSLMDAYKSIYEHHQKDENGNTIPHEGENLEERRGSSPEQLKQNRAAAADAIKKRIPKKGVMGDFPKPNMTTMVASHDLESKGENIDEINASYSTDAGLASTANMPKPKPKLSGADRAKAMAKARIASGKSIADVKAENMASMRSRARARNVDFRAKRRPAPKPMASNPQGMRQQGVGKSANDLSRHSSGSSASAPKTSSNTSTSTSVRKRGGGVSTSVKSFQKPQPSGSNRRAMMSKRRQGLMNDVDLFDLIKGAFIEEGYNESDALAFMVEASPEYLAELDREATMLGLAATSAVPFVAKKLFGKKVDKTIQQQRKTSPIGGENRKNKIEKAAGAEGFFK